VHGFETLPQPLPSMVGSCAGDIYHYALCRTLIIDVELPSAVLRQGCSESIIRHVRHADQFPRGGDAIQRRYPAGHNTCFWHRSFPRGDAPRWLSCGQAEDKRFRLLYRNCNGKYSRFFLPNANNCQIMSFSHSVFDALCKSHCLYSCNASSAKVNCPAGVTKYGYGRHKVDLPLSIQASGTPLMVSFTRPPRIDHSLIDGPSFLALLARPDPLQVIDLVHETLAVLHISRIIRPDRRYADSNQSCHQLHYRFCCRWLLRSCCFGQHLLMHASHKGVEAKGERNVYRLCCISLLDCGLQRHYQFTTDIPPDSYTTSDEAPQDRDYAALVSDSFRPFVSMPGHVQ
jgi:hypothetical protein